MLHVLNCTDSMGDLMVSNDLIHFISIDILLVKFDGFPWCPLWCPLCPEDSNDSICLLGRAVRCCGLAPVSANLFQ